RVVRLRRAEVRFHVEPDDGLLLLVADAFLHDPADVPGIDGQVLARDRHLRDLRLDFVADAVERPAERVGDHRDRLGEPDVLDAAVAHAFLKLLGGQARADLLLERQPAVARVLHARHAHAVHTTARGGQRDGDRVHDEAWVDAGAEHGHLGLLRPRVDLAGLPDMRVPGIRELFTRLDDRHLGFEDALDLRHHRLDRRARAQEDDVRFELLERLHRVGFDLDADSALETGDITDVAPDFRGVDVDRADDLEARML